MAIEFEEQWEYVAHPPELSAVRLMRGDPLPMEWQEQRARLGYV